MHPALSVIFFTVVSGCGYGLWFLLAVFLLIDPHLFRRSEDIALLGLGALFAAAGLVSSTLHLGQPQRAWRAFSQWRSSWLSREGIAALATFVPAAALALVLARFAGGAPTLRAGDGLLRAGALLLAALSVVTVFCTARIYTSLKTIPAWRNRLVLPGYLLFALLGGAAWFAAVDALGGGRDAPARAHFALTVALLGAAAALLKRAYWRKIDAAPATPSLESATGLGRFGTVRAAEAPHTQANYLTREMGFVLARRHSARLRVVALALFAAVPLLAALAALAGSPLLSAAASGIAALAVTAGAFVERWLFFAEARHVVMRYYGR